MAGEIFISYSSADRTYVLQLAEHLTAVGLPVWYDAEIDRGSRWADVIEERINGCAAFVVVMSPSSRASEWVEREIDQAQLRHRPIFPLLLSGERFFRLANRQHDVVSENAPSSSGLIARLTEAVEAHSPWIKLSFCINCRNQFYRDNPDTCSFHPAEPADIGNTGPRGDYRDVWEYPCCGQKVITAIDAGRDLPPPRSPGCVTGTHQANTHG